MSQWELISIELPSPLCNVGCFKISRNEILLLGGISLGSDQSQSTDGVVLMCLEDDHNFLEQNIDLEQADSFPNTMQFVESSEQSHPSQKLIFIQGKTHIHRLDLTDPGSRSITIEQAEQQDGV